MHISAESIPASPVVVCSNTIAASPSITGSCALFITSKLLLILQGMTTQGRLPGQPTCLPYRAAALHIPPP